MNLRLLFLPSLLLGVLVACGGGATPEPTPTPAATRLVYTDPASGTYQVRQNASLSTPTHLVLEVWGPATTSGCGATIAFSLSGSAATWSNVKTTDPAGTYVANGTAFDLGAGQAIVKAKVSGNTLVATVAEKGTASPKLLNKALLQVALDLKAGTPAGTAITLTVDAPNCQVLLADGSLAPIPVTVSGVTAQ